MKRNQSGFTLIEIAIVLVIIGLLLGGVLKGQELINSARVRSLNNNIDGITAAWFGFQDRYRLYPGDMPRATAVAQIDNTIPAGVGGDGNGFVNSTAEAGAVWMHLARAGFISGNYSGAAVLAGSEYDCAVGICPDNRFGLGMEILYSNVTFGGTQANTLFSGSGIPVKIVAELDRKIDDGLPNQGNVREGRSNGAAAACSTGAGAAATYNIAANSNDCGVATRSL
jgi:prepilin-type N-terminal cleavage/methylation domain-containing protein